MGLVVLVVVGALVNLALGLGGGLAPYWIADPGELTRVSAGRLAALRLGNAFAGGILLGAAFCHLLPDLVHAGLAVGIAATPTPYLFVMFGLLLPYVLEQSPLVQWCLRRAGSAPTLAASNTYATAVELASLTGAAAPEEIDDDALPSVDTASAPRASGGRVAGGSGGGGGGENGAAASAPVALVAGAVARSAPAPAAHLDLGHSHAGVELVTGPRSGLSLAFLLVLTLAVHSLLEGIGIGVQDEVASTIGILLAVLGHKGFAAFALGMTFHSGGATIRQAFPGVLLFACMTPIGMGLGAWLNAGFDSPWVDIVSVGLATGTFLYVGIVEILSGEFQRSRENLVSKAAAFSLGLAAFTAIGYVV